MSPRRRGRGRVGAGGAVVAPPGAEVATPGEETRAGAVAPGGATGVAAPPNPTRYSAKGAPGNQGGDAGSPSSSVGGPRGNSAGPRRGPRARAEAPAGEAEHLGQRTSCTLAQMRRFIKSRPYVPVHELRRRFLIEGIEDEVSPMTTGQGTLYVGLPEREAGFLGELVKAGEVGCELLLDPTSPGVVGVFPMRPVARQ